jgi:hypothetical protein
LKKDGLNSKPGSLKARFRTKKGLQPSSSHIGPRRNRQYDKKSSKSRAFSSVFTWRARVSSLEQPLQLLDLLLTQLLLPIITALFGALPHTIFLRAGGWPGGGGGEHGRQAGGRNVNGGHALLGVQAGVELLELEWEVGKRFCEYQREQP